MAPKSKPTDVQHIKDLVPDPENRRQHNPRNIGMIADGLQAVGAARSIVTDENDVVLAGNGVLEAAAQVGITKVRVIEADGNEIIAVRRRGLTAEQKRALAIYDNRAGELAEWNPEQLRADQAAGLDLQPWFGDEELAKIVGQTPKAGLTDPDVVPELRPTSIQRGDLFQLGPHRLLCGDCTSGPDVATTIGGQTIDSAITDPPYAVDYSRSQGERGGDASVHAPYKEGADPSQVLEFMRHLPCDVLVMTFPVDRHFFALARALMASKLEIRKECVWVKDSFSFWPGAQYQQRHEPILICAREGRPLNSHVPANQSTVFELPRPKAHDLHPTEKPAALFEALVTFHSDVSVYEPFAGSGTTLVACERTGRRCSAIEIMPQYCQVILDRWEAFTGQKAEKIGEIVSA